VGFFTHAFNMPLTLANVKFSGGSSATLEAGEAFSPRFVMPVREVERAGVRAVLLSIDGVMVDTRAYQIAAWQQLAEDLQFPFEAGIGGSLPGLPRMDALDLMLGSAAKDIGPVEKEIFLDRQQFYYRRLISTLTPNDVVAGGRIFAAHVRAGGVKVAALVPDAAGRDLLSRLELGEVFDAVFDAEGLDAASLDIAATSMGARDRGGKGGGSGAIVITACERTLRAAKRAKLRTLGIAPYMLPHFVPDAIAPSLAAVRMDQLDSLIGATHFSAA
jgi:beta-phosphoglucomutase-like phosphatase (HAD superfamily)